MAVLGNWALIGRSELLKPCPFCGTEPVMIASPFRFGIQCDNPDCLAMVYTDYDDILKLSIAEKRKITDEELEQVVNRTAKKWNRRVV